MRDFQGELGLEDAPSGWATVAILAAIVGGAAFFCWVAVVAGNKMDERFMAEEAAHRAEGRRLLSMCMRDKPEYECLLILKKLKQRH